MRELEAVLRELRALADPRVRTSLAHFNIHVDDAYGIPAVNWALRNIGKRNRALNRAAIRSAREIHAANSAGLRGDPGRAAARWIASDAIRELTGPAVQERLRKARVR
jgi:hypothetical protein